MFYTSVMSVCRLYLEQDVSLPDEVVRKYSDIALGRINTAINELRRLFLVEDLVDSLKVRISEIMKRTQLFYYFYMNNEMMLE